MYYREFGKYYKYKNQKTVVDGEKFDSKKEANDYQELLFLERRGIITDLKRQVPFVLIEKSKYGRAIKYIADFTYINSKGKLVVADSKGVKTDVYKLKKRLMAEKYDIEIEEL